MPDLVQEVTFEVFCTGCNSGICRNYSYRTSRNRGVHQFEAEPCDKCLQASYEEGYAEGVKDTLCPFNHNE